MRIPRFIDVTTSTAASAARPNFGNVHYSRTRVPEQPLELYSFEASPFARLVRETLCELEIPFLLHNVGKKPGRIAEWLPPKLRAKRGYLPETENRKNLAERGGQVMVPYLVDPNTGTSLYESATIQQYLRNTYGA